MVKCIAFIYNLTVELLHLHAKFLIVLCTDFIPANIDFLCNN